MVRAKAGLWTPGLYTENFRCLYTVSQMHAVLQIFPNRIDKINTSLQLYQTTDREIFPLKISTGIRQPAVRQKQKVLWFQERECLAICWFQCLPTVFQPNLSQNIPGTTLCCFQTGHWRGKSFFWLPPLSNSYRSLNRTPVGISLAVC